MSSVTGWLADQSLVGVALFVLAGMGVAALAGYLIRRLRRRQSPEREETEHNQESYLVGSMLGLLALLLAFSFSIAVSRYEERRQLVIQEANAIGTSYLRTQLLDEPHRGRLSGLLVQYTDNRVALGSAGPNEIPRRLAENDRLLTDIWAAVTAARDRPTSTACRCPS